MESITVNQPNVRFRDLIAPGSGVTAQGMAQGMGGDFFGMFLQNLLASQAEMFGPGSQNLEQLMGQMPQGTLLEGLGGLEALNPLIDGMQQDQEGEQDAQEMAMQMLAELMYGVVPIDSGAAQAVSPDAAQTAQTVIPQQLVNTGVMQQPDAGKTQQSVQPSGEFAQALTAREQQSLEVLSASGGAAAQSGDEQKDSLSGNASFRESVMQAQKLMKSGAEADDGKKDEKIDIDRLQGDVDAGRFGTTSSVKVKAAALPDAKNLMDQVKSGITDNLSKGKSEFVVKLKPEGLGEITVKLVEQGSRIALSITTSSSQVAKLINGEMAGLREALRPFNADVQEVVSHSQAYQTAQDQQSFAQEQQRQYQEHTASQSHFATRSDTADPVAEQLVQAGLDTGLDTYI